MTSLRTVMNSKIHRATVTEADINYIGSITIDEDLVDAANISEWEKIEVLNLTNGSRLETYVILGERGSGEICINGAAAHLASVGDKVIIMHYAHMKEEEYESHCPKVLIMNTDNSINQSFHYEPTPSKLPC